MEFNGLSIFEPPDGGPHGKPQIYRVSNSLAKAITITLHMHSDAADVAYYTLSDSRMEQ